MLHRLGLCLEFISYLVAVVLVIIYAANYSSHNEPFYLVDVDYVKWVTNLPAYTVCPSLRTSFVSKQLNRIIRIKSNEAVQFAKGLVNFSGRNCRHCEKETIKSQFAGNLRELTEMLMEPCENLLLECFWNGEPFQCCRHFQRIQTESGPCFSLNSAHSKELGLTPKEMTTSFQKPKAELTLELAFSATVHIHDNKNVSPPKFPARKIKRGDRAEIVYKFTEWSEDSDSWLVPVHERNCTLMKESEINGFDVYSQSACRMRCKADQQQRECGCKHHLLPGSGNDCDLNGLICLDDIVEDHNCRCYEECSRKEIFYILYSIRNSTERTSKIVVSLLSPPTERIQLTSRFSPLSFIVTLACLSRLVTTRNLFELIRDGYTLTRALCSPTSDIGVEAVQFK